VVVLFSGLLGALLGLIVTGGFHFWKLRRDELNARCDELSRAILDCAKTASAYWADEYDKRLKDMRIAEARILGLQSLFEGLYAELKLRLDLDETEEIDKLMSDLLDDISGGGFTVEGRPPDSIRTRSAQESAAAVVVAIRKAHQNTLPFAHLARVYHESRRRTL